jgi:hypothetical protein
MIRNRWESFLISFFWAVLTLRCAFPNGIGTKIGLSDLPRNTTAIEMRETFGSGDAGSYLEVALSWANLQPINFDKQSWILRLWSPGLSIIEVPLIWLEKIGFNFYWTYFSLLILTWFCAYYMYWRYFSKKIGLYKSIAVFSLLVFSWDFKFIFHEGLFNSEGFSLALLLISLLGILYICDNQKNSKTTHVIFFGILFGFSIWIRHTVDTYLFALLGITTFLLLITNKKLLQYTQYPKSIKNKFEAMFVKLPRKKIINLNLFAITALMVTVPWRLIATFVYKGLPFQMSSGLPVISQYLWATPESATGKYWGPYGSNWACKIDSETCQKIASQSPNTFQPNDLFSLALQSILKNPVMYFEERWKYFIQNWIPNFINHIQIESFVGIVTLGILFLTLFKISRQKASSLSFVDLIFIPLITILLVQQAIMHFESRYFITLRTVCLIYVVLKIQDVGNHTQNSEKNLVKKLERKR